MVRKARSKNKPKTAGHAAATREHVDDEEATLRLLEQFLTSSIARESYADQDLVVATLNIAHLKDHKLTLLLHYMRAYHVDVLCLQAGRLPITGTSYLLQTTRHCSTWCRDPC
jgi:hypothetical protein